MSELLKPCPFCGGEADVMLSQSRWGQSYTIHHDTLGKCPAEYVGSMQFATESEAIAAWNSRAERTCKLDRNDVCSECGACIQRITHSVYEMGDGFACYPKYCPNCGAKVVGE